jgi:iron complex transport system ATP-binding protein
VSLEVRHLSVRIGGRSLIDDVSLSVREGERVGLLGPNGAGKTTTLRAALGFVPANGEVWVQGVPLRTLSPLERARRVTYVPQRSQLAAALSVRSVVEQGRFAHLGPVRGPTRADTEAVDRALVETGLKALAHRPFTELSQGERQLVLLARAWATEAPVWLLDEPTAGLDIGHGLDLFERLRSRTDRAVLLVMHDLNDAHRHCHRVVVLHEGRVVADGPPSAVLDTALTQRVWGVVGRRTGWEFDRAPREAD